MIQELTFKEYITESVNRIEDMVGKKASEYDTSEEDFNTIQSIAKLMGVSVSQAAVYLASKHFFSLANNIDKYPLATIREKVDDIFIYLKIGEYKHGD